MSAAGRIRAFVKRLASAAYYRLLLLGLPYRGRGGGEDEIAVVCSAALGDFIVACSAMRALHGQGKRLTLVCRQGTGIEEFAALTGYFETVIALPHRLWERGRNLCRLKRVRVGTVIVAPAERHILSDLYALAVPAGRRMLPDTMQGCSLPFLKRTVDRYADALVPVDARNEQERYEQYLRGCGLYAGRVMPFVFEWAEGRRPPERLRMAVFPGAGGGREKQWPLERFAYVARRLMAERGAEVWVCGTAGERALGKRLCELLGGGGVNLCGRTDMVKLMEHLCRCSLVLTNDTGSAHLAVACGVPTVVVCGCWEYGRFYPNARLPKTCRAAVPPPTALRCAPCGKSQPDCQFGKDSACCVLMDDEETVLREVLSLIYKWEK